LLEVGVEESGLEESGVEESGVEESGVEESGVEVRPEPLDSPVAQKLIGELNAELSRDYPPAQRFHSLDAEEVAEGAGAFLVLWLEGAAAGCGAVRVLSVERAELKRMYVVPGARGRGLSHALLGALEDRAVALGAIRVVLETGDKAFAALALYESSGYRRIPCFGAYASSPTSVCFEKALGS
jgi:GNAT superfamily N-acetyltransferase